MPGETVTVVSTAPRSVVLSLPGKEDCVIRRGSNRSVDAAYFAEWQAVVEKTAPHLHAMLIAHPEQQAAPAASEPAPTEEGA